MSRREEAKAERRGRIVAAARALIRETGDAGLSMRAIAARANVSLATPYNLFGSKQAVVLAVLEDRRGFYQDFVRMKALAPLDKIFKALAMSLDYHREDPDFYRTIWACLLDPGGSSEFRDTILSQQNSQFWRALLTEAAKDGAIAPDIDLELLRENLALTFVGVMRSWVIGAYNDAAIEPAAGYGYAMALCAAAVAGEQPGLRRRMLTFQRRLARARKQTP
jgi:AcrR family transcriptional regulator